jgi:hypothetical protein
MTLPDGLYDLLVTEGLASRLDLNRSDVFALKGGAGDLLADALTRQLAAILDDVADDDTDKAHRQLELVNALLVSLRQRLATDGLSAASAEIIDLASSPLRLLKAVQREDPSEHHPISKCSLPLNRTSPTSGVSSIEPCAACSILKNGSPGSECRYKSSCIVPHPGQ